MLHKFHDERMETKSLKRAFCFVTAVGLMSVAILVLASVGAIELTKVVPSAISFFF
jgi:hypothetical protein